MDARSRPVGRRSKFSCARPKVNKRELPELWISSARRHPRREGEQFSWDAIVGGPRQNSAGGNLPPSMRRVARDSDATQATAK
jgi:hypothetical protein